MRLGIYLAAAAALCCALDRDVGYLMSRSPPMEAAAALRCYAGVVSSYNNTSIGTEVFCNGKCGSISTTVGGYSFTTYNCFPMVFCDSANLTDTCTTTTFDRDLTGCCCSTDNCNTKGTNINTTIPIQPPEDPIACFSGITINNVVQNGGGWIGCEGECMSVTINSTFNGNPLVAGIYTCDPTAVCSALNVVNKCHDLEPGVVQGCCCTTDACINPTVSPPRLPGNPLNCYVGLIAPRANVNVGAEVACDGKCASLSGMVNGDRIITFQCTTKQVCKTLLGGQGCSTLPGDRVITGCCCDGSNSCNVAQANATGLVPSLPTPSPLVEFPISCWTGVYVNDAPISSVGFVTCNGQCASLTLNTTVNNQWTSASVYMCDPTSVCRALGMNNWCQTVEAGVSGCCCDSDACIYPPRNRSPGNPLLCYVGLYAPKAGINVGSEVYCNGQCSSINGIVNGDNVTAFQCAPLSVCKSLELDNACASLPGDRAVGACCCDNANSCNVASYSNVINPPVTPGPWEMPISCWTGVMVDNQPITAGGFQTCQGDCASITLSTTLNGQAHNATMYMCDPATVCQSLNMINTCNTVEPGVSGCCCSTDNCLSPWKSPDNPLTCYVGLTAPKAGINVGAEVACNGMCSTLSAMVNGDNVTAYQCAPHQVCKALGVWNGCATLQADREVTGCCCDSRNGCNMAPGSIPPTPAPNTEFPISCWSGVYVNGNPLSTPGFMTCKGQCASITLNTAVNGQAHNATVYTCDPVTVCKSLNMTNKCNTLEPGLSGCCCNDDACLTPRKNPGNPLQCYVGIRAPNAGVNVGAEVYCNGMCSSLSGLVNGDNVTTFQCVPRSVCKSLAVDNACASLPGDREVTGCCCDYKNSCSLELANITDITPPTPPSTGEFPLSCWSGIYVNNVAITNAGYQTCQGECASVTLQTTLNSQQHNATIYLCDPTTICQSLNMSNQCSTVEAGLSGCCCNTDACLSPRRSPDNPLVCYVGLYAPKAKVNVGAEVICNGMCSSLNTMVNGDNVTSFQCVDNSVCKSFSAYNSCNSIKGDREITGCCCDSPNLCNVAPFNIPVPPGRPMRPEFPISCWTGIYVNGQPYSTTGFQSCSGECTSLTLNTTVSGYNHTATMYTCDPSLVCKELGIVNNCTTIEDGVSACCCNTDACLTPRKNPGNPLQCYVGVNAPLAGVNVGAEVVCNGMCASLSGTVNGDNITTFQCVPTQVCKTFLNADGCLPLPGDREIRGCCCDTRNSCNFHMLNRTDLVMPTPSPVVEFPISCWTGIYVNGKPITAASFQSCNGQCASLTLNTTVGSTAHTASIYMCDPTSVCSALNMTNQCNNLEPGLGGCCCDTDACIFPARNRNPGNPLTCYVGILAPNAGVSVGADVFCDGQCSTLSGMVNGDNVTTFQCAPLSICKSLEIDNACTFLPTDKEIKACCCDSSNNCNVANYTMIKPPPPSAPSSPISCWSGIYVNGVAVTKSGFQSCYGHCTSITLQTVMGSQQHNATMYMCDPVQICQGLNATNSCSNIEFGVDACCCDSDGCLAPWKTPGKPLTCYAGIYAPRANVSTGAEILCDGKCSMIRGFVNGDDVSTFQCVSKSVCEYLGTNNRDCATLPGDRELEACCCDDYDNCNTKFRPQVVAPTYPPVPEFPISCWSGVSVNGADVGAFGFSTCYGECASATLNTSLNGVQHTATIYACDPTSVCSSLNMINNCNTVESGLQVCCCNTDGCLTPKKKPGNVLWCYVGLNAPKAGVNVGGLVTCDGQCSSLNGVVNGDNVTTFQCVPTQVCKSIGIAGGCTNLANDRDIKACCCDDSTACNLYQTGRTDIPMPSMAPPVYEFPISCWSGIYVNGNAVTTAGYQSCLGECASVSLQTTLNNVQHNATVYMCDPTSICQQLNNSNSCSTIEPGLSTCCCNSDSCLTPTKSPANNPLTCYVGLNAPKAGINVGAETICMGMCASLNGMMNGDNVTAFHCVPKSVCKAFAADNGCNGLKGDREVQGCCCDSSNGCNLANRPDIPVPTPAPYYEYPISCWSGVYVNGNPLSSVGFQTCNGDCASLTMVTTVAGVTHNATIYTCDPATVCKTLGVQNKCAVFETGLSGCCCDDDACISPWKKPGRPLYCYVGLYAKNAGVNVGAEVACNGYCASLNGNVNGDNVTTFQCVPRRVCKTFLNADGCATLQGDREITGCCCSVGDSCNVYQLNRTDIVIPTPSPVAEYPISCWTGIYVNGNPLTSAGYTTCFGECASITLNTTVNKVQHTATMYMCDPSSICQALNMSNTCSTVEPGVGGCCCNTDGCINPNTNTLPGNPITCYVGIYYADPKSPYNVGSEVQCNGQCASLQTTFQGNLLKTYHCTTTAVCKALTVDNTCGKVYKDTDVTACCCNNGTNCNVKENISTNTTAPAFTGVPITCWSGVYVDNVAMTSVDKPYVACSGQCAKLTYATNLTGVPHTLDLYTCDPAAVCSGLGLVNSCQSIDGTSVSGCCCSYDGCVTPSVNPTVGGAAGTAFTYLSVVIAAVYTLFIRQ